MVTVEQQSIDLLVVAVGVPFSIGVFCLLMARYFLGKARVQIQRKNMQERVEARKADPRARGRVPSSKRTRPF